MRDKVNLMAGTKNNRRTQYTIQVIKEAFLHLLNTNELSKITVTQICKEADVNRGTFYLHFDDPLDLFHKIEAEFVDQIRPVLAIRPQEQIHDWLKRLTIIFKDNEVVGRMILANYRNGIMVSELFSEVREQAIEEFKEVFNEKDPYILKYYFSYFANGTVSAILSWLEDEEDHSIERITKALTNVLSRSKE
ncbi:TetR/AcrR family transcriptional regulator [Sporolactobacillus shoreicorticis]|uniref:TetR/AcrR family transcriptional regulator n=1 Tax=Sporolactobacillus shoreicorticis TaxID=1923877 RepID=A0ABW5S101_9BACL|nr:TetR/AcrR family transcriptional regulator [Sporolactobacillus shoreicorticis]MCO7124607.1 TetR/AcrR family transcriptional regulator [Sporolactobacillus shoreicorticis]